MHTATKEQQCKLTKLRKTLEIRAEAFVSRLSKMLPLWKTIRLGIHLKLELSSHWIVLKNMTKPDHSMLLYKPPPIPKLSLQYP